MTQAHVHLVKQQSPPCRRFDLVTPFPYNPVSTPPAPSSRLFFSATDSNNFASSYLFRSFHFSHFLAASRFTPPFSAARAPAALPFIYNSQYFFRFALCLGLCFAFFFKEVFENSSSSSSTSSRTSRSCASRRAYLYSFPHLNKGNFLGVEYRSFYISCIFFLFSFREKLFS